MREQICEMCESRPANCGLIDIVNRETIFLCYHCSEKLADIHERVWGHVVRCKDCKFGEWCSYVDMNGETETVIVCHAYEVQKDIDGFCDEGERRGEEDE